MDRITGLQVQYWYREGEVLSIAREIEQESSLKPLTYSLLEQPSN